MIRYLKIKTLTFLFLLSTVAYSQQENGVIPIPSTIGNEIWYFIETAYSGTANVPESLVNKHIVLYSQPGNSSYIKYRQSKGTDDELWAIITTGSTFRLKNKATGQCMYQSHSESKDGDSFTYTPISGSDQYSINSSGYSKTIVWTNYNLNRSSGDPIKDSNFAFRFIPKDDPKHLEYIEYSQKKDLVKTIPTFSSNIGNQSYQYINIDMKGLSMKNISLVSYDNEIDLTKIDSTVISLNDITTFRKVGNTYEVPVSSNANVFRIIATYAYNNSIYKSPYWDKNQNQYTYWTDMKYTASNGWGPLYVDKSNGAPLTLAGKTYAKGFGIHSIGHVESTGLIGYTTFKANVGKQSGQPYIMGMTLRIDDNIIKDNQSLNGNSNEFWEANITNASKLRIDVTLGDNNNGNDLGAIAAPRFYIKNSKESQTISWTENQTYVANGLLKIPLNATSSSGNPIQYSIETSTEYASIDDNILTIASVPFSETIVVKAIQFGTELFSGSTFECAFTLENGITVQKDETITIPANARIKYLTVHGDKNSAGQVRITDGLATIEQYKMIYTFHPNEWTYITFPSDINILDISNFDKLGYSYNTQALKSWEIKEFTGTLNNQSPSNSFETLATPFVKSNKGYLIRINDNNINPVEIHFTFNNKILNMSQNSNRFNLSVDLSTLPINGESILAISSKNEDKNTLTIKITYDPIPKDDPMDYKIAATNARFITFNNDREFRMPLPNRQFANIFILNTKANKVLRHIKYQSPASVDISKLKSGKYPTVIQYGDAFILKELIVNR